MMAFREKYFLFSEKHSSIGNDLNTDPMLINDVRIFSTRTVGLDQ